MDGIDHQDTDLIEFRGILRRVLDRHGSDNAVPSDAAGSYNHQLWTILSHQIGVAGLCVPEKYGGSGGGYLECHLVLDELGRSAVASPFLASSVLATQALLLAGDDVAAADLLPDLAAGTRTAALIWNAGDPLTATPVDTWHASDTDPSHATDADASWVIDGRARHVLDGARADLLLVLAESRPQPQTETETDQRTEPQIPSETALFLLDTTHPGLQRDLSPTIDQTLHLAEVRCHAVPARRLSGCDSQDSARTARLTSSKIEDLAAIAITAEQIGGARRCLELTVEYVKHRVQFGRPIGSFQAVKHRLADLLVLVESAHSASQAAAQAWDDDPDGASVPASLAKSYCSEAYRAVAAEAIQLHGGLGFTWEHPAHRYFKRAHSTSALFGDPAQHRLRLADHLGLLDGLGLADPGAHPGGKSVR